MGSEAHLLAEKDVTGTFVFEQEIRDKHMGGVFVNTDLGRPPVIESSSGGEMRLPGNNTWGEREWHEYALTPDGLFEGDMPYGDFKSVIVEFHEIPFEEEDIEPEGPVDLSQLERGDQAELQVLSVSKNGQIKFVAEFIEQDELVNDRSIRIFNLISSNGYPPFLAGETVAAVVKTVNIALSSMRTKDGRRYIFFGVDEIAFR